MTQETTPASDPRLDEWEKLANAATPGPWKFSPWHVEDAEAAVRAPDGWVLANTTSDANAAFIASAREAVPALIAMVRKRDATIARLGQAGEESNALYLNVSEDRAAAEARATAAEERVKEMEAALEEIADPLSVWRKRAEAEGRRLSGMAYQIANSSQTLKDIARAALGRQA